jgi:hypothetical protein
LRIIEQGHIDSADTTFLYVPSIGLVVAGDVVYNQCHMYVGDTTPESRKNWVAALDRLAPLKPSIVVAGHKKPGAPDSPSAIEDTKRYLLDFDRLQKTATSDEELFNRMTELYPHWVANQWWLMFGFPGAWGGRSLAYFKNGRNRPRGGESDSVRMVGHSYKAQIDPAAATTSLLATNGVLGDQPGALHQRLPLSLDRANRTLGLLPDVQHYRKSCQRCLPKTMSFDHLSEMLRCGRWSGL